MKGSILDFSIQTNTGIISGDDSNRYHFIGSEWKESVAPVRGMKVDFDIDAEGKAVAVYKAIGTSNTVTFSPTSNVDKQESDYNFIDWTLKGFKNFAVFDGRARRKEFWFLNLANIICGFFSAILDLIFGTDILFGVITLLIFFIPILAASSRRLHDINRSGWWYLISLTGIGLILLIIWWAQEGETSSNQYGEPAK